MLIMDVLIKKMKKKYGIYSCMVITAQGLVDIWVTEKDVLGEEYDCFMCGFQNLMDAQNHLIDVEVSLEE